jgi:hypothetical protein
MKFSKVAISATLLTLSLGAFADDAMPTYADHAIYPSALMTQGFFVSAGALYTKNVLASNAYLADGDQVLFNQPWGFAATLGYETHVGQTGSVLAGVEGGYRYMGQLSFSSSNSSGSAPGNFKLQAGTALVDLGLQMSRLDMIAKGGLAVELGGRAQDPTTNNRAYTFDMQVVPMAGGEVGFAVLPNLKLSAELDYIFGHKIDSNRIGTSTGVAASGGYQALTGLVGFTYYMN